MMRLWQFEKMSSRIHRSFSLMPKPVNAATPKQSPEQIPVTQQFQTVKEDQDNQFTVTREAIPNPQAMSHYYKTKIEKKVSVMEKVKEIWKHMVHSLREIKTDAKFVYRVRREKGLKNKFSLEEYIRYNEVIVDLIKFLPYSIFIFVPFAELALPFYMWLLPNSTPNQFLLKSKIGKINAEKEKRQEEAHKILFKKLKACMPEEITELQNNIETYNKDPMNKQALNEIHRLDSVITAKFIDQFEEKYQKKLTASLQCVGGRELLLDFYFVNYISGIYMIHRILNAHIDVFNIFKKYVLRSNADPVPFIQYNYNIGPIDKYRMILLDVQLNNHISYIQNEDVMISKDTSQLSKIDASNLYLMSRRRGLGLETEKSKTDYIRDRWISEFGTLDWELKHWINILRFKYNDIII